MPGLTCVKETVRGTLPTKAILLEEGTFDTELDVALTKVHEVKGCNKRLNSELVSTIRANRHLVSKVKRQKTEIEDLKRQVAELKDVCCICLKRGLSGHFLLVDVLPVALKIVA